MSLIIDPSTLSPTAWYIGETLTGVDGSAVSSWPDSSGNGRDLTQVTGSLQPKVYLNVRNRKRGVLFDGTDDFLSSAADMSSFLGAGGIGTVIAVIECTPESSTTAMGIWGANVANGTQLYLAFDANPKVLTGQVLTATGAVTAAASAPRDFLSAYTSPDTQFHVVCWQHTENLNPETEVVQVRAGIDSFDHVAMGATNAGADTGLAVTVTVGKSATNRFLSGYILELIFFNTALSAVQRQGVQLYLTNKYALAYGSGVADEGAATADINVEMKLPSSSLTLTPSAWFKADAISTGTTDGTSLSAWSDSSTEGHNLAQAASTSQPVYSTNIINSLPAVLFQACDYMATTGALNTIFSEGGQGTVYAVAKPLGAVAAVSHVIWSSILVATSSASGMLVRETTGSIFTLYGYYNDGSTNGVASVTLPSSGTDSPFGIYAWLHGPVKYAGSYIGEHIPGFDWTSTGLASASTTSLDDLANNLYVGASATGTTSSLYLSELMFFRERHTQIERRHVHAYLSDKYGLAYFSYSGSTNYEPVWQDVTTDIRAADGIRFNYGINGAGPQNRVSQAGRAQFSMENSPQNSGGVIGYYSPDSTSCRMGWTLGVPVRISFDYYGTSYYKWLGQVTDILPSLDRKRHVSRITAMDYVDELSRITLNGLDVATSQRADQVFATILVNFPRFPTRYLVGEGADVFPYVFDNARDEDTLALAEFNRLSMSEFGYTYIKGDADGGGTIVFEARGQRDESVRWAMTESNIHGMAISNSVDDITNRALVKLHPRRVDAAASSVLFSLGNKPLIAAGASISFKAPYRDPNNGRFARVGGTDMLTPVSAVDYTANTLESGAGTSLTTGFSVTADFGGNAADLVVTNGSTQAGYLTLCQLRGRGLYSFEEIVIKAESTPSIDKYGANTVSIDMPYQSDPTLGYNVATELVANNKDPRTRVRSIAFQPGVSSVAMMHAVAREPGDRVSITETISGLSTAAYHIQGIDFKVKAGQWTEVSWKLAPAAAEDWAT